MPKVRVFSAPSCPYCYLLEMYLQEHSIEFEKLDVSQNQEALRELQEKTGALSIPVIEIDGEFIIGFDKEKINHKLNISE